MPGRQSPSVTVDPTDSYLVARLAEGDREALAVLFRRHQGSVYRFSRQMLGAREAAEDITQEVFVALVRSSARFDPAVGSLTTYLYGIARNLVWRQARRRRAHLEVDIVGVDVEDAGEAANPAAELSRRESVDHLRRAILRLPVHYREVIVLCELNGLSYEDAARVVCCPVGTIRSRLSRARQMLIERCRASLRGGPDEERVNDLKSQGTRQWLIPTKNNC